jgi:CubicO group peptidase (beta-lactamase class C family)
MKSWWLLAAGLALGAGEAAAQAPPAPAAAPAAPREQVFAAIDERFARYLAEQPVPGLVWGVVQDGRLVHVRGLGNLEPGQNRPVSADSLFRIASMSKAFTGLAILKLRDEGKLRLDDLAEQHVPELRNWRYPTSDSPRIRVRDLLAHAGGFVTDDPWGDRQQVLSEADFTRMLRDGVPFTRAPQLSMEYSNFGYALLGRIVTNASGRPYKDYIEQTIMRPLGMTSSGYEIAESPLARRAIGYRWENDAWAREPDMRHGTFGAMGGVQTSANDYAKWIAFLLSAWPARDGAEQGPVRRATVREMGQGLNFPSISTRASTGGEQCPMVSAYGMGLIALQDCNFRQMLSHSGGYPGYGSFMVLLPEHNTGLFAFTNRTYTAPSRLVMEAAQELLRAGLLPSPNVPVSDALAAAYGAAGAVYQAGSIEPARPMLAMNFLMDRSPENWARTLGQIRRQVGACQTGSPIVPNGALAGNFSWTCERGRLEGRVLLAPTKPPTIQALNFRPVPAAASTN